MLTATLDSASRAPLCTKPLGPSIVGATGGSGTRAISRILQRGGMYIGDRLSSAGEHPPVREFMNRWVDLYLRRDRWTPSFAAALEDEMARDLAAVLEEHLAPLGERECLWGWKQPRSILMLPFLDRCFPGMKLLHFVRDGRDMAYSDNQTVFHWYGSSLLAPDERVASLHVQSIKIWSRVNLAAARYAEEHLGDRYLRLRFEDLCAAPAPTIRRLFDFFGLEGDVEKIAREEVRPPRSIGRWSRRRTAGALLRRVRGAVADWRRDGPALAADVARAGEEGLRAFGY